jgi:hypothetical protein
MLMITLIFHSIIIIITIIIIIVTDLINALPGSSFLDTVQHATIDAVFSMTSAPLPAGNGPINSQCDTSYWFSVWSSLRNNRTVFSVPGPCREDMRKYGNGNWLDLSSEVLREQQCGQKKKQKT